MSKDKSGIYKIINLSNNKIYVGSAINIRTRWNSHRSLLNNNKHDNNHLQNAWNRYSENNFRFEIIEYVNNKNNLLLREQFWINKLNVCDKTIGYNLCPIAGSRLGQKISEESKNRISQAQRGKKRHPLSKETKEKISKANKGRIRRDMQGSNSPTSKLNEDLVTEIKNRVFNGEYILNISSDYNIDVSVLYDIVNGIIWKHVLPGLDLSNYKNKTPGAKLNKNDVLDIREKLNNDYSIDLLSKEYNVTKKTIKNIRDFKTWKNVLLKEYKEVI